MTSGRECARGRRAARGEGRWGRGEVHASVAKYETQSFN